MTNQAIASPKPWYLNWLNLNPKSLVFLVALPGAAGGFITMMLGNGYAPTSDFAAWEIMISLVLGSIAGFIVVVVLTNTDRNDFPRLFTLSFVAGLAYGPIISKGLEAIGLSEEESRLVLEVAIANVDARESMQRFKEQALKLDVKNPNQQLEILNALEVIANRMEPSLSRLDMEQQAALIRPFITELQQRLPREEEEMVFRVLRNAGFAIDPFVIEDEADFFEYSLSARIPNQLMSLPAEIDRLPDPFNLDEVTYAVQNLQTTVYWLALRIDAYSEYLITVSSEENDLVAALYSAQDFNLITYNDDSGLSSNPEIISPLDYGMYYLRVSSYMDTPVGSIEVAIRDRNELAPQQLDLVALESAQPLTADGILAVSNTAQEIVTAEASTEHLFRFQLLAADSNIDGIPVPFRIVITSTDENDDLVAAIYDANSLRLILFDDDSAGEFNPAIDTNLRPGTYLLRVSSFGSDVPFDRFQLRREW